MSEIINNYQKIRELAKAHLTAAHPPNKIRIYIGLGTCGIAAGGKEVLAFLHEKLTQTGIDAQVIQVGCIGMCFNEPLVDIAKPGLPRISYGRITPAKASQLVDSYLLGDDPCADLAVAVIDDQPFNGIPSWKEISFFKYQHRRVLQNCGIIDPELIEDYIVRDGYLALAKALAQISPEGIITEVKKSGLRGRGGAGFPTGLKWQFCHQAVSDEKYVVCNFDEGDPGAFMNRSQVEGDPHRLLEGMAIAAYAIGAQQGFIYGRAEYPLAIQRLRKAIAQAEEWNLLGDNILGSGFSFHITIKEGAGAFVCGEETALMASIEGRRGMPRPRPPFPVQSGLWGKPTLINNVGTLTEIPDIILKGADWFAQVGTEKNKGTKVFSLVGKVNQSGLVEVPMGIPLRTIIFDIGGGIPGGKRFKAVQTGGPSGGCLPASLLDLPVDYDSLTQAGSIMGSGGMVVMDEETCMVDVARYFLSFTQSESCGKCVPCRLGTKRMLEILERIVDGKGKEEDIGLLLELGETVKSASLCGLGQTAVNPVLTTLRYFRDEYEAHIRDKRCPALRCEALISFFILPDKCQGCGICRKACPTQAIAGDKRMIHVINQEKCIKCGTCLEACPPRFSAVVKTSGEKLSVPSEPVPVGSAPWKTAGR
jgi:NADH-quinone oxidoreductase subunit F